MTNLIRSDDFYTDGNLCFIKQSYFLNLTEAEKHNPGAQEQDPLKNIRIESNLRLKNYPEDHNYAEIAKLFGSIGFAVVGGLLLGGVITFPISSLATIMIGLLIEASSGTYALYKISQHFHEFLNPQEEKTLSSSLSLARGI